MTTDRGLWVRRIVGDKLEAEAEWYVKKCVKKRQGPGGEDMGEDQFDDYVNEGKKRATWGTGMYIEAFADADGVVVVIMEWKGDAGE